MCFFLFAFWLSRTRAHEASRALNAATHYCKAAQTHTRSSHAHKNKIEIDCSDARQRKTNGKEEQGIRGCSSTTVFVQMCVSFVEFFIEEGREIAAAAAGGGGGGGGEGTGRTGAVESVGGFRFSKRKIIT